MQFSKIGITSKGLIEISYLNHTAFLDQNVRKMGEPPLPTFMDALQDLAQDMNDICDLRVIRPTKALFVRSVNFKMHDDFGLGISITAERLLDNGKSYKITGPVFWSEGKHTLPLDTMRKTELLQTEATKYLNGERLQGRLNLPPSKPQSQTEHPADQNNQPYPTCEE